jgi:hypothetical protein
MYCCPKESSPLHFNYNAERIMKWLKQTTVEYVIKTLLSHALVQKSSFADLGY